jgi:RNA polymerase sigma factor (TIGR02999 family)
MPGEAAGAPPAAPVTEVTDLLEAWRASDGSPPPDRLAELVYAGLRKIARRQLRRERSDHTFCTTALVHEAYLKLVDQRRADFRNRGQFFAVAATWMRRILVDQARARLAGKRAHRSLPLSAAEGVAERDPAYEVLDLDRVLGRLAAEYPRPARVVELRYFAGLELAAVGETLGVGERTVLRDWEFARAWLARELARGSSGATPE